MGKPSNQLRETIDFALDGSCSDDQREEFVKLIDENPELTPKLVEQVFMHSLLQWQVEETTGCFAEFEMPVSLKAASSSADNVSLRKTQEQYSNRSQKPWLWAAAAILFVGSLAVWQLLPARQHSAVVIAEIVDQQKVAWSDESKALLPNGLVSVGRLQTESGSFTMKFRSGPVIHVNGPSSMMIESGMLVHLDRGQVTAHVPEEAIGFAVKTPVIDVIDQGTEFGVAVRSSGHTDIVVFDGEVDLADSIGEAGVAKRLVRGEAARVDRQGVIERIMNVGRSGEGGWWTFDYPSNEVNLILRVRDNIPPDDGSKFFCYQITYHGLDEDVDAYVDHPHQWNGVSADGLPKSLLTADFIKTFNDYRYVNDFEMVIELARPANLYVFFDDRVPPPAWLLSQFEDSGIDIGLDEGPWEGIPDHVNAKGPGNSIDNVFSVWRRRCLDTSPVALGPVGESSEARAMYGIAATPLDAEDR